VTDWQCDQLSVCVCTFGRLTLGAAATLPQLALLLHEATEACTRDKGRMRLQRDAFQRFGRNLATTVGAAQGLTGHRGG